MFSLRKVAFTVSSVRNKSMRTVFEANVASRHVLYDVHQSDTHFTTIEGVQGHDKRDMSVEESRQILEESIEYSIHGPSIQGIQGGRDELATLEDASAATGKQNIDSEIPENLRTYSCSRNINLHGCMQTNVPDPYVVQSDHFTVQLDHGTPQNMPGNGKKLYQKYISGGRNDVNIPHQRRSFHVGAHRLSQAAQLTYNDAMLDHDPNPQGIQGDDCVQQKLWMETCLRYGLPNCDEQYQSIQSGRKTLAQVFSEQEEIIRNVAESYRKSTRSPQSNSSPDAMMDVYTPEGIQGDDCVHFRLWLENCNRFNMQEHCKQNLHGWKMGRKTLADIFNEQDQIIRSVVKNHQQRRHYSTSKENQEPQEVGNNSSEPTPSPSPENSSSKYSRAELSKAIKEYGGTVGVFHISISLMSLGGFYVLVSSGIDVVGLLTKAGIGQAILQSKLAAGASTFIIAYAVHKVFAPVRIGITLFSAPFIVRYLRRVGFLKAPPKTPPKPDSSKTSPKPN